MKTKITYKYMRLTVGAVAIMAAVLALNSQALTISSSPLVSSDWQSLTASTPQTDPSSPKYGPPPAARFYDGPMIYGSGENVALYAGPDKGRTDMESILFVFSARQEDLLSLGTINFTLDVGGTLLSQSFLAADFLSTSACYLPQAVPGMGDGAAVLDIIFPDAYHAAARVWMDLGTVTDAQIGTVKVTTTADLRLDIFGVGKFAIPTAPSFSPQNLRKSGLLPAAPSTEPSYLYRIANNTPNSGAAGFHQVPDGGTTAFLLGCAIVMLGITQRVRAKS